MRLRRWGVLSVVAVLGAGLVGSVGNWVANRRGFSRHPPPGTLVDVGGHRLHVHCTGAGTGPTVVFESALGGWSIDWAGVQAALPSSVRACSYDRAGYGWSDPSGRRATPAEVAEELATLLDAAGESGPFVLVGHSLGGIYARQFAHRYPERVAGLVMVDSSHEQMLRRFPPDSEVVRQTRLLPVLRVLRWVTVTGVTRLMRAPVANLPDLPEAQQRIASAIGYRYASYHAFYNEAVAFTTATRDPSFTPPDLPAVPMVVLASSLNLDDPVTGPTWQDLQTEIASATPDGHLEKVQAGHFIQIDNQESVLMAISNVLEQSA